MARKSKVVLVVLSPKLEDGSRRTLRENEICSCNERGTAELIRKLLAEQRTYKQLINKDDCRDDEHMYFISVV